MEVQQHSPPPVEAEAGKSLALWCLSDLALLDEWGQPTLEPSAARLGLGAGRVDWDRSFLRFRRYAPWNAHRRAYDLERQVIQRGSVIALTLDAPLTDRERSQLMSGVGMHREAGLGRVCVNPRMLAAAQPEFEPAVQPRPEVPPVARPTSPLIDWLERQVKGATARDEAERQARKLAQGLAERYRLARVFAGLAEGLPVGPSPAQWGSVYERARTSGDLAAVRRALFEGDSAICKPRGEGWQDQFRDDAGVRAFFDWFNSAVTELGSIHALRAFGREAQRTAQHVHGGADHREQSA